VSEIDSVRNNDFNLSFHIPTEEELKRIRLINRDRTQEEKQTIEKASKEIDKLSQLIDEGIIDADTLPQLRKLVRKIEKTKTDGVD
jgi:superfamily I DNA and RNA helicase